MNVAWATDIHLNFLSPEQVDSFCDQLLDADPEVVLLAGDIAEAHNLEALLGRVASRLQRPIYFVLGNHDFYRGDIAWVRDRMRALTEESAHLRWMPAAGVVPLTDTCALVGHDGWGDGRLGDPDGSRIELADWSLIQDFRLLSRSERLTKLRALGDEAAAYLRPALLAALARFRRVVILTHVPPFREATWHDGRPSADDWLPWFSCKAVGDVLLEVMRAHPDRDALVLCGHTHGAGEATILPNLSVKTGGAVYGAPAVQDILDLALLL